MAVIDLEMEPSRYSVCAVAGTALSRSALPKPADHSSAPFSTTATETPGVLLAAMKRAMAASSWARFCGLICGLIWPDWADAEAETRMKSSRHATRSGACVIRSTTRNVGGRRIRSIALESYFSNPTSRLHMRGRGTWR